jgi:hypothetical protein
MIEHPKINSGDRDPHPDTRAIAAIKVGLGIRTHTPHLRMGTTPRAPVKKNAPPCFVSLFHFHSSCGAFDDSPDQKGASRPQTRQLSATRILPGESAAEFEKLHRELTAEFSPNGALEDEIVAAMTRLVHLFHEEKICPDDIALE